MSISRCINIKSKILLVFVSTSSMLFPVYWYLFVEICNCFIFQATTLSIWSLSSIIYIFFKTKLSETQLHTIIKLKWYYNHRYVCLLNYSVDGLKCVAFNISITGSDPEYIQYDELHRHKASTRNQHSRTNHSVIC